jgi:hypothetical protein
MTLVSPGPSRRTLRMVITGAMTIGIPRTPPQCQPGARLRPPEARKRVPGSAATC